MIASILLFGIREPFRKPLYRRLFGFSFFAFFALFVFIPVWAVPGNTLSIQLELFTARDYAVLVLLSLLSSLFITLQGYIMRQKRKMRSACTAAVGGGSALFAGIAGTAFCASCLAPLFAFFGIGFGGAVFVLEYRNYVIVGIALLLIIAIYLTARKIHNVCTSC